MHASYRAVGSGTGNWRLISPVYVQATLQCLTCNIINPVDYFLGEVKARRCESAKVLKCESAKVRKCESAKVLKC